MLNTVYILFMNSLIYLSVLRYIIQMYLAIYLSIFEKALNASHSVHMKPFLFFQLSLLLSIDTYYATYKPHPP